MAIYCRKTSKAMFGKETLEICLDLHYNLDAGKEYNVPSSEETNKTYSK